MCLVWRTMGCLRRSPSSGYDAGGGSPLPPRGGMPWLSLWGRSGASAPGREQGAVPGQPPGCLGGIRFWKGKRMNLLSADLVGGYASLFVHQWSSYALQESDGSYRRITHPLSFDLL